MMGPCLNLKSLEKYLRPCSFEHTHTMTAGRGRRWSLPFVILQSLNALSIWRNMWQCIALPYVQAAPAVAWWHYCILTATQISLGTWLQDQWLLFCWLKTGQQKAETAKLFLSILVQAVPALWLCSTCSLRLAKHWMEWNWLGSENLRTERPNASQPILSEPVAQGEGLPSTRELAFFCLIGQ